MPTQPYARAMLVDVMLTPKPLQQMGAADFAGGIAIHTSAGIAVLFTVLVLGKRNMMINVVPIGWTNITNIRLEDHQTPGRLKYLPTSCNYLYQQSSIRQVF